MKQITKIIPMLLCIAMYTHIVTAKTKKAYPQDQTITVESAPDISEQKQINVTINPHLQDILQKLSSLAPDRQPKDIAHALQRIMQGAKVYQFIQQAKIYDACSPRNLSATDSKILQTAFNSTNEHFWKTTHNNQKLNDSTQKCSVACTIDNFNDPKYNIFFRVTYAKTHVSDEGLQQYKNAYQNALVALQWYLFAQAILQDSMFTSGIITIPDAQLLMFKFMDGYGELVSSCYRFYSALSPHSLWQSTAYTRKSNHFNGYKLFNDSNFGIDLKDQDGAQTNLFPCNTSHLLFGALKNGMTFVKWEDYGITINLKEKNFSAIKHTMGRFQKQNKIDDNNTRKDKTPQDVHLQFRSLHSTKLSKQEYDLIQTSGISAMLGMLPNESKDLFKKYLTDYKKYDKKTLPLRKGNEIILQPNKFVSFT